MAPFQALYGREPPTVPIYHVGTSPVHEVDKVLLARDELLAKLKKNLASTSVMLNSKKMIWYSWNFSYTAKTMSLNRHTISWPANFLDLIEYLRKSVPSLISYSYQREHEFILYSLSLCSRRWSVKSLITATNCLRLMMMMWLSLNLTL